MSSRYRGWIRPGPCPPGGVEPDDGETLDYISGNYRIFQYARGHRYSIDDVLTAWYGTQWCPRAERVLDLGSGIGSVALVAAWRLPAAQFCTVEAQEISIRLARKSVAFNDLTGRFKLLHGDFREPSLLASESPFDLVLGSPPYFPEGTAVEGEHPQTVPARVEIRGSVDDYAASAARSLAPGGFFAFVLPTRQLGRAERALESAELFLLRRREIVFKEGEPSLISLFGVSRRSDFPSTFVRRSLDEPLVEPPLVIRTREGAFGREYTAVRIAFGFPPGNVAEGESE